MPSALALVWTCAALAAGCRPEPVPTREAPETNACVGRGGEVAKPGMRNVLGTALQPCPARTATGFYRDGFCSTGPEDTGVHVVCATVTDAFLTFSAAQGNDLITPRGAFPGLRAGDAWCLCAARYREALDAGVAPPVIAEATDEAALRTMTSRELSAHAQTLCRP